MLKPEGLALAVGLRGEPRQGRNGVEKGNTKLEKCRSEEFVSDTVKVECSETQVHGPEQDF